MKNKTIIVDLDGTIANIDQRRKESQIKDNKIDWEKFFNPQLVLKDKPNAPIINLLNILKDKYNIIITSGRLETTEKATLKWLNKHKVPYNKIYMRKVGDRKPDDKLKEEMLFNDVLPNCNNDINNIEFVLDDRNVVVEKWRQLGLTCLQVDRGDF